jgi:alkylhydroperoxidase/carboxymuconolactone decarboxylase family protein YurZ
VARNTANGSGLTSREIEQDWEYIREAYRLTADAGRNVEDRGRPDPLGYEILSRYRPEVLHGYITLRKAAKNNPRAVLSDAMRELIIVAIECARTKVNGPPTGHAIRAIHAGATVEQVAEVVSLCILIGGMLTYQESGKHALRAAEETAASLTAEKKKPAAKTPAAKKKAAR